MDTDVEGLIDPYFDIKLTPTNKIKWKTNVTLDVKLPPFCDEKKQIEVLLPANYFYKYILEDLFKFFPTIHICMLFGMVTHGSNLCHLWK